MECGDADECFYTHMWMQASVFAATFEGILIENKIIQYFVQWDKNYAIKLTHGDDPYIICLMKKSQREE